MTTRIVNFPKVLLKTHLRVAAYCRVSSSKDEQQLSLDAQISYYKQIICTNPRWNFAGVYADQASGRSNRKMRSFQKMLQDCRNGEIDLILVKSISRFGRNTLELLVAFRELRALNIDVFFELENIHLMDQRSEVFLTIYASVAQAESESKSYCISWGIRKRFMDGSSGFISRPCYGYERDRSGNLAIIPEQAKVIRAIYGMHQSGASLRQIASCLSANLVLAPKGGQKWHPETLRKIINNEKYYGYVRLQKTFVSDYLSSKQRVNRGELDSYIVYDTHIPIIDRQNPDASLNGELKG